jgi:hypothetical protein
MKKFYTLFLSLAPFFFGNAQTCIPSTKVILGSQANGFTQLLLTSGNPGGVADATQPEIAAAAWTCNSSGSPECFARSLFKYDISSIPVGATIVNAKLYLFAKTNNLNGNPGNPTFGSANTSLLQKVVTSWQAAQTSWNTQPTATATNQKTLAQSTSSAQNYIVDITDFAKSWQSKPDSNFGMLLRIQTEQYYNSLVFHSGQSADNVKPRLEISYTLPGAGSVSIPASDLTQLLLTSVNPGGVSDATQPEIVSAAWTCSNQGVPECFGRSLIKYNLTTIPSTATVTSAKLHLFAKTNNLNGNPGNPTFGTANTSLMQKVTTAWVPAQTSWNTQPTATVTNQKTLAQSTSSVQDYTVDITDFVQSWVNKPDSNFGMLFRLQTEQYYNSMVFHSGTSAANVKPRLEICYNVNTVLPLTLKEFTGVNNNQVNSLKWSVFAENTCKTIELEKSINGNVFTSIKTFNPLLSVSNQYAYSDAALEAGVNRFYYRLKFVSLTGSVTYSNVLALSVANAKGVRLQVYPNPAVDYTQLIIKANKAQAATIRIATVTGSTVYLKQVNLTSGSNTITINKISKFSRGTYFVMITSEAETLTRKLLIAH